MGLIMVSVMTPVGVTTASATVVTNWPLWLLAILSLGDALLSYRPVEFVGQCLTDVRLPHRYWWCLTPVKLATTVGLIVGVWIKSLAITTTAALVVYFMIAIAMHLRAHDFGRNLFVNAGSMLTLCLATLLWTVTTR